MLQTALQHVSLLTTILSSPSHSCRVRDEQILVSVDDSLIDASEEVCETCQETDLHDSCDPS